MPDAGRQIWEIRVPKVVKLTPSRNMSEQKQNKSAEEGTKRNE